MHLRVGARVSPAAAGPSPRHIVMPKLGLTMTEATVVAWLKKPGDYFFEGEPILEVETDKTTQPVPAPFTGCLARILVVAGGTALIGEPVAEAEEGGSA